MKKYKQCIQIGNNITEIMKLPCVVICEKEKCNNSIHVHGLSDYETIETVFVFTLENGEVAKTGEWIVLDVCDNWHVMTNDLYEMHKNDEIENDSSDMDGDYNEYICTKSIDDGRYFKEGGTYMLKRFRDFYSTPDGLCFNPEHISNFMRKDPTGIC